MRGLLALVICLLASSIVLALDYDEQRRAAVRSCEAISPSAAESGLAFNPDGYRSFYVRSKCFQEAAVRFRDQVLCQQVKERRSLLFSSWGYSAMRCGQLVSEGAAADRRELEAMRRTYLAGGITLRDFRVERNGNGRDIDIIPSFSGTYAHGYILTFEILADGAASPVFLHSSGYYLDANSNLDIYIPTVDIRRRFSSFALNRTYTVRATVTLDVGNGGQSGLWSEAFIDSVFPRQERAQAVTRQAAF